MKILHVSSGDLLRDEVETGSLLGQQIAETMRKGVYNLSFSFSHSLTFKYHLFFY
jgi:adenylate kinase family enzyme